MFSRPGDSYGTKTSSPTRAVLVRLSLILPAFVLFAVVAAKPLLTDTPIGPHSMLLLLVAIGYLAACSWFSHNDAFLGRLALASWALVLSGLAAGSVVFALRSRSAAKSVDAVEEQWKRYFEGEPWFEEYRKEFRVSTRMQWYPYVLWRRRPFAGKYINVDATGKRKTWNADGADPHATRVFVLGGSTAWGNGARDDYTIPSYVSRFLAEAGHRVRVTNYAELGFVSTQNLITLTLALQNGEVPRFVLCYDGVNDVYAALQSRQAGVPQLSSRLSKAMNGLFDDYYRKVTGLVPDGRAPADQPQVTDDELIEQMLAVYLGNLRIINRLAESHGFKTLFFWQPTALVNKPLSPSEADRIEEVRRVAGEFIQKAYGRIGAARTPRNFRNISDVFSSTTASEYFDFCHTTEEGNRLISRRMSDEVQKVLESETGVKRKLPSY